MDFLSPLLVHLAELERIKSCRIGICNSSLDGYGKYCRQYIIVKKGWLPVRVRLSGYLIPPILKIKKYQIEKLWQDKVYRSQNQTMNG